jgi:hypothetical protein
MSVLSKTCKHLVKEVYGNHEILEVICKTCGEDVYNELSPDIMKHVKWNYIEFIRLTSRIGKNHKFTSLMRGMWQHYYILGDNKISG